MRRSVTFRLENKLYSDVQEMAKTRGIPFSQVLSDLIEIGLRVKKHMDSKKSDNKEELQANAQHLEIGASSSIETLLLLRKIAKETHPNWVEEAHTEAKKRVAELKE